MVPKPLKARSAVTLGFCRVGQGRGAGWARLGAGQARGAQTRGRVRASRHCLQQPPAVCAAGGKTGGPGPGQSGPPAHRPRRQETWYQAPQGQGPRRQVRQSHHRPTTGPPPAHHRRTTGPPQAHHRPTPGPSRPHLLVHRHELLAVEPDIVVGAALGGQQVGDVVGRLLGVLVLGAVLVGGCGRRRAGGGGAGGVGAACGSSLPQPPPHAASMLRRRLPPHTPAACTPAGAMPLRLPSPHAPSVLPMFLITVLNTVFRSSLSTPCSW